MAVTMPTSVKLDDGHKATLLDVMELYGLDNQSEAIRRCIEQMGFSLKSPGRKRISEATLKIVVRIAKETGVSIDDILAELNGDFPNENQSNTGESAGR